MIRTPGIRSLTALLAALAFVSCGGDGGAPDPTPSPAVSPVPSTVAVDLALADRLYVAGDTEEAVRIYSAAVLRGTPEERQHGLWSLARIQFEQGDESKAADNTAALIASEPEDDETERRAYLLLGYAEMAQGNREEAREALEKYIRLGGPATPYAQLKLAEITAAEDDPKGAARGAEQALSSELPAEQESAALLSLARYQAEDEDIEAALATLTTISSEGATASDSVEALWETARIAAEQGNEQGRQDALRSIIVSYPSFDRALEALEPSTQTSIQERALVLYRHQHNQAARDAYQLLLADPDPNVAGEAHYRLGILAERAGDPGTAVNEYGSAIAALTPTGGALLDDAYWDRGLALETLGRLDEAVTDYSTLAELPLSDHAEDALERAGMIRYRQGLPAEAAALWERRLASSGAADDSRIRFWLARAYGQLGDVAQQQLQLAEAARHLDYHGLRAAALIAGHAPPQDPPALQPAAPDWNAVEAWLTTTVGPEPSASPTPAPDPAFFSTPGWLRAEEVMETGLVELAIDELRVLLNNEDSAWVLYRLARRLADEGYVRNAALAAGKLLAYQGAPPALYTLIYPAKYLPQVNAAAAEFGISPILLLSLVRQESFFDASAVSVADALGLTQVIPATGQQIAAALGVQNFRESDLLQPETSLRFGAYYIATQLQGFGGNTGAALSAYNGGPGNAARWSEAAGNDIDQLIEAIDFDETRRYVALVLENHAFYRYAYGLTDTLSLPLAGS
jgi:soluble lytic murein transglycosylase